MRKVALIVAGGKGVRMNSDIPKQFLLLKGTPVLMRTIEKFSALDEIILVLPKTQIEYWENLCKEYSFSIPHTSIEGGETRFHSVKNGLDRVKNNSIVAIHDGVRPIISAKLIDNLINEVKDGFGVIPIIPIRDSIRKIDAEISTHVDRTNLYKVQTPQCFLSSEIKNACSQEYSEKFTDDASVFESNGGNIKTIIGEAKNLKITTKEDLKIASILF
ncbi:MAG: 2-C-methyl-D-erythritol 4-phosphate cytidylyltransferase [Flavobacteriales bacterium]|nr:2-C-methyl-D-erythritol 4-phosphate cytidylyltransferase [Flavobacteriales bacterium]|tara:strand:- start:101 stop:751 length:651 start_codon:yes stop_codon:yes gene_type:complete